MTTNCSLQVLACAPTKQEPSMLDLEGEVVVNGPSKAPPSSESQTTPNNTGGGGDLLDLLGMDMPSSSLPANNMMSGSGGMSLGGDPTMGLMDLLGGIGTGGVGSVEGEEGICEGCLKLV